MFRTAGRNVALDRVFVFGDRLSDSGNVFLATGGATQTIPFGGLIPVDAFGFLSSIAASAASFGLSNGIDPCIDLTAICSNPDEFVFYDGIHVTTATHAAFAQFAGDRLNAANVPEPSTLLGFGVLTRKTL